MRHFILLLLLTFTFPGTSWSQIKGSTSQGNSSLNQPSPKLVQGGDDNYSLFIPNAFTPNGDGINDTYHIPNLTLGHFSFQVFDRWGNKVYETKDTDFHWDGTSSGRQVKEGVYVFMLEGTMPGDILLKKSGALSVVR